MLRHRSLKFRRTARGIDRTGELDQHAISSRFDDATALSANSRVNQRLPERLELFQRAFLVDTHQSAIACNVGRKHRRESPFDTIAGHEVRSVSFIKAWTQSPRVVPTARDLATLAGRRW